MALDDVYHSFDPDAAQGAALDNLLGLVGLQRKGATRSQGTVTILGEQGTLIPAGFEVKNSTTDDRFLTTQDATIDSTGQVVVPIEAVEYGAIEAEKPVDPNDDTFEAVTVNTGVSSLDLATSLTPGTSGEKDADVRLRREKSLQVLGKGTVKGIEADLLQLDFLKEVLVLENDTAQVNSDGVREYSLRPVLYPSSHNNNERKQEIARVLWGHKSGVYFDASDEVVEVKDDVVATSNAVRWDWAKAQQIYVDIVITKTTDYPADGDHQAKTAVMNLAGDLGVGEDVIIVEFVREVAGIEGVIDVDFRAKIGAAPSSVNNSNIEIAPTEIAEFESSDSRLAVSSIDG